MPGENDEKLIVELKPISAISPSVAETLRNCPLQAALSRISEIRSFTLENPKAWLGIAYHEVLEKLWSPSYEDLNDEVLVEHLAIQLTIIFLTIILQASTARLT